MTEKNRLYIVYGDLTSDKSSDNYPQVTLCSDCVAGREIVSDLGASDEPCEECGE